jgi:hypothetical protein
MIALAQTQYILAQRLRRLCVLIRADNRRVKKKAWDVLVAANKAHTRGLETANAEEANRLETARAAEAHQLKINTACR